MRARVGGWEKGGILRTFVVPCCWLSQRLCVREWNFLKLKVIKNYLHTLVPQSEICGLYVVYPLKRNDCIQYLFYCWVSWVSFHIILRMLPITIFCYNIPAFVFWEDFRSTEKYDSVQNAAAAWCLKGKKCTHIYKSNMIWDISLLIFTFCFPIYHWIVNFKHLY